MKEKILNTATNMFLDLGFKSVTMDDISNELGISKKTIYTHFKNKISLVEEVCSYLFETISHGINKICEKKNNSIEELFEIKAFVMEHLKNEKSSPQYQLQKFIPELNQKMKSKHFEVMKSCIINNLTRGIDDGFYRENIEIEFVTRIYFAGMHSLKDEEVIPTELYNKQQAMTLYLDYHVRAIATPKGIETLESLIKNEK